MIKYSAALRSRVVLAQRLVAGALLLACAGCVYAAPYPYRPAPYPDQPPPPPPPAAVPLASAPAPQPSNCREFTQMVTIDGKQTRAYGTTCQEPDGSWRVR